MQLRARYWDSRKMKWTISSVAVEIESHWTDNEKQEQVDKTARVLQEQYELKHNTLNNIPRGETLNQPLTLTRRLRRDGRLTTESVLS